MNATSHHPLIKQVKKEFYRGESVIINKRNPFQDLDTNQFRKEAGLIQKAIKQEAIEIYETEDSPVKVKIEAVMPPCSRKRKASTSTSKENNKERKTFKESIEMINALTPTTKEHNKTRKSFKEPIEMIKKIDLTEIITIDDSSDDEWDIKPIVNLDDIVVEPRPMKLIPIRKCEIKGPQLRSTDASASPTSPTTSTARKSISCTTQRTSSTTGASIDCTTSRSSASGTARKSFNCATIASINCNTPRSSSTTRASVNCTTPRSSICTIKSEPEVDANHNITSQNEDAASAPEFIAIKAELLTVEMPTDEFKQEEEMVNEQTLDDLPEAYALTLTSPMISRFEELRPERLEVQLERYDQDLQDYSVPVEISKQDEAALKVLHGIDDCSVRMEKMRHIYHFAVVGSLGFSKEHSAHGIVLKCIKGCGYQDVFHKYKLIRSSLHQHFKKMHADDDSWHGFCSACGIYIHDPDDPENGEGKLTMESELEHIIKCHTRSDVTDPSIW